MTWLAGLHLLFKRTEGKAPPIDGFLPLGMDVPDRMPHVVVRGPREIALVFEEEPEAAPQWRPPGVVRNPRMQAAGEDLWGVTFGIEYVDAHHHVTTRRITLRELYRSDDGVLYLQSFCHERKLVRSFRFDRIKSVIDLDGVAHAPREFFETELHFPIAPELPPVIPIVVRPPRAEVERKHGPTSDLPGRAQRFVARDGLRVLAALGRADGFLAEAEVEVILNYVIEVAAEHGIASTEKDREALRPYLRRQYPTHEVLEECLARLENQPDEQRKLFLQHASVLVGADGIEDFAESDMLRHIKERL